MKTIPAYSTDLIKELDKLYPPRCVRPGETLEEAHRYAGKRDVVEHLKHLVEATHKKAMEGKVRV